MVDKKFPGCMLADKYTPKMVRGWRKIWAEPKLDGMRICITYENGIFRASSRSGKDEPYTSNLKHIIDELPAGDEPYMIDGEIFSDSWGETMHLTKKSNISESDRQKLRLRAFDFAAVNDLRASKRFALPLAERRAALESFVDGCPHIVPVEYRIFDTVDEKLDQFYTENLAQGYEGIMLKNPDAGYSCDRSPAWLKMKPLDTADAVIIGFEPGKGRHEGRLGAINVRFTRDGKTETVSIGGGFKDAERDWIWQNRPGLVGMMLEFAYQKDDVALARFPIFKRFRWDREVDATLKAQFPSR